MQEQQPPTIGITVERPDPSMAPHRDAVILRISGELGLASMIGADGQHSGVGGDTALAKALREAVPQMPPLVIIDLSGVTYLSSLGMGALLRFQNQVKEAGGVLRLTGVSDMVLTLLRRCRLDHAFKIDPDAASAMKA